MTSCEITFLAFPQNTREQFSFVKIYTIDLLDRGLDFMRDVWKGSNYEFPNATLRRHKANLCNSF